MRSKRERYRERKRERKDVRLFAFIDPIVSSIPPLFFSPVEEEEKHWSKLSDCFRKRATRFLSRRGNGSGIHVLVIGNESKSCKGVVRSGRMNRRKIDKDWRSIGVFVRDARISAAASRRVSNGSHDVWYKRYFIIIQIDKASVFWRKKKRKKNKNKNRTRSALTTNRVSTTGFVSPFLLGYNRRNDRCFSSDRLGRILLGMNVRVYG